MHEAYDFLIVGQGLAGTILSHTLIERGYSVKIIDNQFKGSSSIVAAGIINPFTGPRLNLTQNFFEKFTKAKSFYLDIEKKLDVSLFHSIRQKRFLSTPTQYKYYLKRAQAFPKSFEFISKEKIHIHDTACINVKRFLKMSRDHFNKQSILDNEHFNYSQLQFHKNKLSYKDSSFKCLIFCEGYQNIHNPFFKHDLFQLSKGSIMNIEVLGLKKSLYNWGHWLSPDFNTSFRFFLGSSYHWDINHEPKSSEEYEAFISKLPLSLKNKTFVIKEHHTGIRPTTLNRQTLIQASTQDSRLWIFNGFGSKGCLEIPHHAEKFANSFDKK